MRLVLSRNTVAFAEELSCAFFGVWAAVIHAARPFTAAVLTGLHGDSALLFPRLGACTPISSTSRDSPRGWVPKIPRGSMYPIIRYLGFG